MASLAVKSVQIKPFTPRILGKGLPRTSVLVEGGDGFRGQDVQEIQQLQEFEHLLSFSSVALTKLAAQNDLDVYTGPDGSDNGKAGVKVIQWWGKRAEKS